MKKVQNFYSRLMIGSKVGDKGSHKKTMKLWALSKAPMTPPPRLVWTQKVWTLRLGSDTRSISDRILIN